MSTTACVTWNVFELVESSDAVGLADTSVKIGLTPAPYVNVCFVGVLRMFDAVIVMAVGATTVSAATEKTIPLVALEVNATPSGRGVE